MLKAPTTILWFQRLKLQYDEPLSNFASNFNLRRYTSGTASSSSTDFSFVRRGRDLFAAGNANANNGNRDMVRPRAHGTTTSKYKTVSCRWRVHLHGCVNPVDMSHEYCTDIFGGATVCPLLHDTPAHRAHRRPRSGEPPVRSGDHPAHAAHRSHRRPRGGRCNLTVSKFVLKVPTVSAIET